MGQAVLHDAEGHEIGHVRAGQLVRVLKERWPDQAFVAVDGPLDLRGWMSTDALRVFLKRDLELEKGRTWWLAGTEVVFRASLEHRFEIAPAGAGLLFSTPVSCGGLSGRPLGPLTVTACHGALLRDAPVAAGQPIHFADRWTRLLDWNPPKEVSPDSAGLLREKGDRAYVEIIDRSGTPGRTRHRGWVNRAEVLPGADPDKGEGSCGCCEGMRPFEESRPGGVLEHVVELAATPRPSGAKAFVRMPAGVRFRVLGAPEAGMRHVMFLLPRWNFDDYKVMVQGWARVQDLPAIPVSSEKNLVFGHLVVFGAPAPDDFRGFVVTAASSGPQGQSQGTVQPDGQFVVEVSHWGAVRLDARSPDGVLAGTVSDAIALPGGQDPVSVPLLPRGASRQR